MQPVLASVPTLAVTAVFYVWHAYRRVQFQQRRRLCERVAYMLWVMANLDD
jgi:hypothetical protein